ncbi:MAG: response regulator [Bacteroidota bacterium]
MNDKNLKIIVEYLEEAGQGYQVLSVADPQLAVKVIQEKELDLVITDWQMPKISGLELIHHFKQAHPYKKLPFIMVTGIHTTFQDLKVALEVGALDFIRKPINKIELWARVASLLNLFYAYKVIDQQKDESLSNRTLQVHQHNKLIFELREDLEKHLLNLPLKARNPVKAMLQKLPYVHTTEQEWARFKERFEQIHPHFFKTLQDRFRNLRIHELRMCAYIRVGFSIKEIANFLNIEQRGARVKKSRIKKKMGLSEKVNFDEFIRGI